MVGIIPKRRTFRRLLVILFLFGGSGMLLADVSDQVTCADVHAVEADPTPQNVLGLYSMRRPEDQRDRIYLGDLQGQHPLFQDIWALRGQRMALDKQFGALMTKLEEYKQEMAARQDQLAHVRQETRRKQQELELEATRLRVEHESGRSPFTAEEVQEKVARINVRVEELNLELVGQAKQMTERNVSELRAQLSRARAIEAEMEQVDAHLAEKSRALLEDEWKQACAP